MNKGATGLNQVRFLRDCAGSEIETRYGILWGNPGETAEDYERMTELIPFISHLPPPGYLAPVSLERFSPYFMQPERFGIGNIRPAPLYPLMFGGRNFDYSRLAYVFYYEHASDLEPELKDARIEFFDTVAEWRNAFKPYTLLSSEVEGELYIADRRAGALNLLRLRGLEKDIMNFCAEQRKASAILRAFPSVTPENLCALLDPLVTRRLLLAWGSDSEARYLALPIGVSAEAFYEKVLRDLA
jgi:hypothetical protein